MTSWQPLGISGRRTHENFYNVWRTDGEPNIQGTRYGNTRNVEFWVELNLFPLFWPVIYDRYQCHISCWRLLEAWSTYDIKIERCLYFFVGQEQCLALYINQALLLNSVLFQTEFKLSIYLMLPWEWGAHCTNISIPITSPYDFLIFCFLLGTPAKPKFHDFPQRFELYGIEFTSK